MNLFLIYAAFYIVIKLEIKYFISLSELLNLFLIYTVFYVVIKLERKSFSIYERAFEIILMWQFVMW